MGRSDSAACTWQSKEAINHEDNASSPLSEPRSLEGCLRNSHRRKRRENKEEDRGDKQKEYGEATSPKVQAKSKPTTGGLLVLLTNFSIHRLRPPPPPPSPFLVLLPETGRPLCLHSVPASAIN